MPRPLKVGVQLPEVEYVASWEQQLAMARTAEQIGLDSVWVGDHLLYRDDGKPTRAPWEAWTTLAALAAVTRRVEIGPLVAATSFHNPAMLAKKAATIDEISGGRLILGLGAGWNRVEYEAYGFAFDHRVSRFEEAFTIIRELLREGRSDFHGAYYQLDDCVLLPRGPRSDGPPLMVGSEGPRMLGITLPHVDAWNAWFTWFGNTPDGYRPMRARIDEACRAAGRDPSEVERTVALFVAFPGAQGRSLGDLADPDVEAISGEPAVLVEHLRAFAEEGVSHVQLVLDPITADTIGALRPTLERLDA
ncbi:MAG TPA: LLM class flavin-dependent oxidoreductase [Candidatus Limnocylindria bacterium]|jgi:alkanesulfonate monooxygenase SsuD/methylene tetrahydromethanopterin reductase-like flavin-dependent oxidoreductase (luciferase family)